MGILSGLLLGRKLSRENVLSHTFIHSLDKKYGGLNKQKFLYKFLFFSSFFICLRLIFIFFGYGIGVLDPASNPIVIKFFLRITASIYFIYIILLLLVVQKDIYIKRSVRLFIISNIILVLFSIVFVGSRAAFISLIIYIIIIKIVYYNNYRLPLKYILLIFISLPFLVIYVYAINYYREYKQYGEIIINEFNVFGGIDFYKGLMFFSKRTNGFDLLIATNANILDLTFHINIFDGIKRLIDSFYPGSFFTYMTNEPAVIVTETLRKVNLSDYVFYREHLSLIPMALVYFHNQFIACIFLLFYFLCVSYMYWSTKNICVRLLLTYTLVIYSFEMGFIEGLFSSFLFAIIFYYLLSQMLRIRLNFQLSRFTK